MRHQDHSGKRDALIKIMNATYETVRVIEAEHGLSVGDKDFRPRIEYFHDAVRVLSHRPEDMYLPKTRLSVEHLAYDMSCLRYIQERPLAKLNPGTPSPKTRTPPEGMAKLPAIPGAVNQPVAVVPKAMTPYVKVELAEHYRSYTVLYAALFAETADINFQTRQSENDTKVEDMAQIEQMIKLLEQGQMQLEQVEQAIEQLEDVALRTELMAILHKRGQKKREMFALLGNTLKQWMWGVDAETKSMDKAHMNFLSGQMVMYQESKDLIRKLSAQGMAMAGKFLEDALSQAAGRGQGQGR